jgi:hypothetical protein
VGKLSLPPPLPNFKYAATLHCNKLERDSGIGKMTRREPATSTCPLSARGGGGLAVFPSLPLNGRRQRRLWENQEDERSDVTCCSPTTNYSNQLPNRNSMREATCPNSLARCRAYRRLIIRAMVWRAGSHFFLVASEVPHTTVGRYRVSGGYHIINSLNSQYAGGAVAGECHRSNLQPGACQWLPLQVLSGKQRTARRGDHLIRPCSEHKGRR